MPRLKKMPRRLVAARKSLPGSTRRILDIAEHHDGRWPIEALAILTALATRISAGQRECSNDAIGRDVTIAGKNVAIWTARLEKGGYLDRERLPGPHAHRYSLRMPSEAQLDWHWLDQSDPNADFDADRHRALGEKLGFDPRATDLLIEFRQNLALPRNRA